MNKKLKKFSILGIIVVILLLIGYVYWDQEVQNEAGEALHGIQSICLEVEKTYKTSGFFRIFAREITAIIRNPIEEHAEKLFTYAGLSVYPQESELCEADVKIKLLGIAHKNHNAWAKATSTGYIKFVLDGGELIYRQNFRSSLNLNDRYFLWIPIGAISGRTQSLYNDPTDAPFSGSSNRTKNGFLATLVKTIIDIFGYDPIIDSFSDSDETFKRDLVWVIGDLKLDELVEPLIDALDDPSEIVRSSTVFALAEISDDRAIEPLIEALKIGSGIDKNDVEYALLRITGKRIETYEEGIKYLLNQRDQ